MEPVILKQAQIKTLDDFASLQIVDWNRWRYPGAPMSHAKWLISCWYTIVEYDLRDEPLRAGFAWLRDSGEWGHSGHAHNVIGHQYWSLFKRCYPDGEIHFADSPDFSGYFMADGVKNEFMGDVGTVSASAFFLDVVPHMSKGTLWITVHERHQILIEASYDIERVSHDQMATLLGLDTLPVAPSAVRTPTVLKQLGLWP